MLSDICFFNYKQGKVSLYPSLDYLSNVIEESMVQTASLRGLRQLSIIRREEGNYKQIIVIYNYRYSTSTDSFGVCLVIKDYYPCGVSYLFSFIGKIIAEIVNEGKVLYLDNKGFVQVSKDDIVKFSAVLQQHIDYSKKEFNENKAEFVKISSLSSNYYNIYKDQTIIHQLSDDSWTISEALEYNNIVIITEEIEDENINSMRNRILGLNKTIENQQIKIGELESTIKRLEQTRNSSLSSILETLKFAPSKQSGMVRTRESLIRLEQEKNSRTKSLSNKKMQCIILVLFGVLIVLVLYFIHSNPSLKFLLIPN